MPYCSSCGSNSMVGSQYCSSCGRPQSDSYPAPNTTAQVITKYCQGCGNGLIGMAVICTKCGSSAVGTYGSLGRKKKTTSILLAVFLSGWTWLYTYDRDKQKFWIFIGAGFAAFILTITAGIGILIGLGTWIWSIVDVCQKHDSWYSNYPRGKNN